jgi:hypothetical protein
MRRWSHIARVATVGSLVLALLSAADAIGRASVASSPQVTLTAPADGATVHGTVTLSANGSTDPAGTDLPSSLTFDVDGTYIDSVGCDGISYTCSRSVSWDSTNVTGSHTLTVTMDTSEGSAPTDSATVTADNPGPTVVITSPHEGDAVSGKLVVQVTATMDQGSSDTFQQLELDIDGAYVGAGDCSGTSCQKAIEATPGFYSPGHRTLTVKVFTSGDRQVTSAPVHVTILAPAQIAFDKASLHGTAGKQLSLKGTAKGGGKPLGGRSIVITAHPVLGAAVTKTVQTDAQGHFSLPMTLPSNAMLHASFGGDDAYAAAARDAGALIGPAAHCSFAHSTVKSGDHGSMTCQAPHEPDGTIATMLYEYRGTWYRTARRGQVHGGRVTVTFSTGGRATYPCELMFKANRVFAQGPSVPIPLKVV